MTATRPPMLAADYLRELIRPYLTSESVTQPVEGDDGKWRTTRRLHTVHHASLLTQLKLSTLSDDQKGAHVGKANTGNIGICYVGGVDKSKVAPKDTRTPAQKASLATLIRTYQERYPGIIVRGHRDWPGTKKACPSFDVAAWLKAGMPA